MKIFRLKKEKDVFSDKDSDISGKKNFFKKMALHLNFFWKREIWKSEISLWLVLITFIFNAINWSILFVFIRSVDADIILHYNVYFGVDQIGNSRIIFTLPLIGFFLFIINLFLADFFYRNCERIASYILLLAALMVQVLLVIASISVIVINY